ncbi:hypothetical protein TNCV_4324961 [Trichonephila clavipes]|nr:hypothetical protein TNCV_4324961 [Trichonephila clavipes]
MVKGVNINVAPFSYTRAFGEGPRNFEPWSNYPTVLPKEFVAVDDDNVCAAPLMADKDILEFLQSSKSILDADSDDEVEMNNAAPFSSSS